MNWLLAVDPTAPADPAEKIKTGLAHMGDYAVDAFTSMITKPWVLALFAAGIALSFAWRVINRAALDVSRWNAAAASQYGVGGKWVYDRASRRRVWMDHDGYVESSNDYDDARLEDGRKRFSRSRNQQGDPDLSHRTDLDDYEWRERNTRRGRRRGWGRHAVES